MHAVACLHVALHAAWLIMACAAGFCMRRRILHAPAQFACPLTQASDEPLTGAQMGILGLASLRMGGRCAYLYVYCRMYMYVCVCMCVPSAMRRWATCPRCQLRHGAGLSSLELGTRAAERAASPMGMPYGANGHLECRT